MQTEQTLSLTGQILGTHKYLAPEYIQDNIITPKLDIYQIALVLVELLTGKSIIQTDHALTGLRQHIRGSIEIPFALLSSPLGPILLQALSTDPDDRFPSAITFARALSSVSPLNIPHVDQLTETIALDVYKKGNALLGMSSEDEEPSQNTSRATQKQSPSKKTVVPMIILAVITVLFGIFLGMQ